MKSLNSLKGVPGPHIPSRDMYAMFLGSEAPECINKYIQKQSTLKPFNFRNWLTHNFSQQYSFIIQQTGN